MLLVAAFVAVLGFASYSQQPQGTKAPDSEGAAPLSVKARPPAQSKAEDRKELINAKLFNLQPRGASGTGGAGISFTVPSFTRQLMDRQALADKHQLLGSLILRLNPTWRTTSDQNFHQTYGKPDLCLQKGGLTLCPKGSLGLDRVTKRVKWSGGLTFIF